MEIAIRPATADDLPALMGLDHLALQSDQSRQAFIRHALAEKTCRVAALDGQVVGYGVLEYTFFACGFISVVYVHADYRRRRVGQALLAHLEKTCETAKLFTSTNLSNLPMQTLLAQQGYTLSGVIHNLDEGDPELVYFKPVK